jgi:nucleoside-diphosphate-sugar epimerase
MILGCGYTGSRVAARLLARGIRVVAAAREASALEPLAALGATIVGFDATRPASWTALAREAARLAPGYGLLVSVPPVEVEGQPADATAALLAALPLPGRVVYLSSTAVYGDQLDVDAATAPAPRTRAHALRLQAERAVTAGPWSWMILRAAAIYGPERGLHVAGGSAPRRASVPDRVVSRIHVHDLVVLCEAALHSAVTGTFPAADLTPASAREIAAFCARIVFVPSSLPVGGEGVPWPGPGRRVDGRTAFDALRVPIAYPSYREGILASLTPKRRGGG